MKLYTPEKSELLRVTSVEPHPDGVLIHGRIMGTMPMKAVLRPEDLRSGFSFLTPRLAWTLLTMLLRPARQR
jgi:hypothetical protein